MPPRYGRDGPRRGRTGWGYPHESLKTHFLEVDVANEVLEAIANRQASPADRCDLLIYYAENDAYPNWIYER